MKKLLAVLGCLLVLAGCGKPAIHYDAPQGTLSDMSGYGIADGHFYDITYSGLRQLVEAGQTVIVYIGHLGCNWCRQLVPVLDGICAEEQMDVYYLDTGEGSENLGDEEGYQWLNELCADYTTRDKEGNVTLWAPSVIYIRQGAVIGVHEGTVNTHNANERQMTDKEIARLQYNLRKGFENLTQGE
jgi:predicted bacteriocin transport accessory protein